MLKYLILFLLVAITVSGCVNKNDAEQKPTVTVSILPQKFFVDQIAGEWLNVNVMVPPGGSPATYEPTPLQMTELAKSSIYFRIGHITFEKAWMHKLVSIHPKLKVVNTAKGMELITEEDFCSGHGHSHGHSHSHEAYNPHIWLSPKLVKIQAEVICNALCEMYPNYSAEMKNNLDNFYSKIDSVQFDLEKQLKGLKGSSFIVYHPVWSYLAADFQLKQIAIEHNGKEATASKLKQIIDFANKNNVKVIFIQKEFSNAQAKSIAAEINGTVATMNPLNYNWFTTMKEFGDTFSKMYN